MKVLVTGASGMLGGAVARALAQRGDEVTVLQRRPSGTGLREVLGSVTDAAAVRRAVTGQDAVVHLAAKVDVVGPWAEYVETNVVGTSTLLREAADAGVARFVQTSSPSVAHAGSALVGQGAGPADPDRARGSYARSKALAERAALAVDRPGFAVCAVRPHLVWGPGDTQLVGRLVERARTGRVPVVGSGAALVDSTFVTNAADALVAALDRCAEPEVAGRAFVVTNGEPRPIGELVAGIIRAGGSPEPRRRVPAGLAWLAGAAVDGATALSARLPGVPEITEPPLTRFLAEQLSTAHWFDQRETRQALRWEPRVSIEQGLQLLARSYARAR